MKNPSTKAQVWYPIPAAHYKSAQKTFTLFLGNEPEKKPVS